MKLYEAGAEGPQWWVRLARRRARPADRRHPRPLHGEQDLPEDHRALRRGRSVGAEAHRRLDRHRRRRRHSAAAQRAPLLHRRAPRTAAAAAASPTTPGAGADLPGHQLRRRHASPPTRCRRPRRVNAIRAAFRDWVMNGTPPPPSRYPTIAGGELVESRQGRRWAFPTFRRCWPAPTVGTEQLHQADARLRLGPRLQLQREHRLPRFEPPPIKQVLPR